MTSESILSFDGMYRIAEMRIIELATIDGNNQITNNVEDPNQKVWFKIVAKIRWADRKGRRKNQNRDRVIYLMTDGDIAHRISVCYRYTNYLPISLPPSGNEIIKSELITANLKLTPGSRVTLRNNITSFLQDGTTFFR